MCGKVRCVRMKKRGSQVKWMLPILLLVLMLGVCSHALAAENDTSEQTVVRVGYTDYGMMIREKDGAFTGYGVHSESEAQSDSGGRVRPSHSRAHRKAKYKVHFQYLQKEPIVGPQEDDYTE